MLKAARRQWSLEVQNESSAAGCEDEHDGAEDEHDSGASRLSQDLTFAAPPIFFPHEVVERVRRKFCRIIIGERGRGSNDGRSSIGAL